MNIEAEFEKREPWFTEYEIDGEVYGGDISYTDDFRVDQFYNCFPEASQILELGSLEGGLTFELAKRPGVEVTGIESYRENVERAEFIRDLLDEDDTEFVHANLEEVELDTLGEFDAAFCSATLAHLPEPWDLIDQLSDVCPQIYIWTHYAEEADVTVNGYEGRYYEEPEDWDPLSGLSQRSFWPSLPELKRILHESGFQSIDVLEVESDHPNGPVVTIAASSNSESSFESSSSQIQPKPSIGQFSDSDQQVISDFHELFYNEHQESGTWEDTYWLGTPVLKSPFDLWVYQEILAEVRPDVIVEAGTKHGGSAYFLASICDLLDNGEVVTIDIEEFPEQPTHDRITYLEGSSTSEAVVDAVRERIAPDDTVLVTLDSDHSKDHVLDELRTYSDIVTNGSYLIVEDTNLNGNPVRPDFGSGPMKALEEFLEETDRFEVDETREKFLMTFHPRGFLSKHEEGSN